MQDKISAALPSNESLVSLVEIDERNYFVISRRIHSVSPILLRGWAVDKFYDKGAVDFLAFDKTFSVDLFLQNCLAKIQFKTFF
jgi:hypothetical protein